MELKKISDFAWEIKKEEGMKVPAIVFASRALLESIKKDQTLEQLKNVAKLPGIVKYALAMPDAHQGYGFPIGGVAAFDLKEGVVSPGGVGYDINCGVRILRTPFLWEKIKNKRKELISAIFNEVPAGVGKKGVTRLGRDELKSVLEKGAAWAVEQGYGIKEDLERTEEHGCMGGVDFKNVSERAMQRGLPQLGTLGSGNHFIEIQKVDRIFDKSIASKFGIDQEGQILVMIHSGSRGLGHQVASDYIKKMEDEYGFKNLPDRELVNAPINSELGQNYLSAMWGAMNFAFANRQMMMHWTREAFKKIMGSNEGMSLIYDVCHNIAKIEDHLVDGKKIKICVHRKGATRSFGAGRKEIPEIYREAGQPVLIPGSMGTASYILVGTSKAEELSFGSTAHGAGRVMSRHEALKQFRGEQVVKDMEKMDIFVKGVSWKGIAEETYQVYKDIDEVIRVSDGAGIGKIVARVVPVAVMKG